LLKIPKPGDGRVADEVVTDAPAEDAVVEAAEAPAETGRG